MLNGKTVVGIVPNTPDFGASENRYDDYYKFNDTYCVRVTEAGMIPLGILPVGTFLAGAPTDLCDAFLLQGGTIARPYHVEVIDYAVKTGKKVLGICLGCQAIQSYFATKHEAEARGWTGNLGEFYLKLCKEGYPFLQKTDASVHRPSETLPRVDVEPIKHRVTFTPGSHAAEIFGTTEVSGASIHFYCIGEPAPGLVVTGRADDGTVEAVEAGDKIIGVQFHPDVDDKLPQIFAWLGT